MPTRLTWHPGADVVQGFTPDGKAVLFTSRRERSSPAATRSSSPCRSGGGVPAQLPIPNAFRGHLLARRQAASPTTRCRRRSAVEALPRRHRTRGSGSTTSRDHAVEKIPQPAGRCNDIDPMWIGDTVYFRSDRNGEFNLFSYDTKTEGGQAADHATRTSRCSALRPGGGQIVYEQAGYLHLFDPAKRQADAADDRRGRRPGRDAPALRQGRRGTSATPRSRRRARAPRSSSAARSSPCRPRRAIPRNLTDTPGRPRALAGLVARRQVASPTSPTQAASTSCTSRRQDGKGEAKTLQARAAPASTTSPVWSPDSQKIAFTDNSRIAVLDRPRRPAR